MQFLMMRLQRASVCLSLIMVISSAAFAQLRVATWNVTLYSSGRQGAFAKSLYGVFQGRTFAPDVLVCQELVSQTGVNNFLFILNNAEGSPKDWAAAPFTDGPDTDSAFFYRTSRVNFVRAVVAARGSTDTGEQPRNTMRYEFRPTGYVAAAATIAAYSVHLKSGTTATDQQRRKLEADRIVADAKTLEAGIHPIVLGDFNIQTATQAAYVSFVGNAAAPGLFYDPIKQPGSWNNNSAFSYIHTQDPANQVDDRHDQILIPLSLFDGKGLDFIGDPRTAFTGKTWDDPLHAYRCWGNDGESYNKKLRTVGNTMVGEEIALALIAAAGTSGHLPVFMDLKVPPKALFSTTNVDFGKVKLGEPAVAFVDVWNAADRVKWGATGVNALNLVWGSDNRVSADGGRTIPHRRGAPTRYTLTFTPTAEGPVTGSIKVQTDDPDSPEITVNYTANVRR